HVPGRGAVLPGVDQPREHRHSGPGGRGLRGRGQHDARWHRRGDRRAHGRPRRGDRGVRRAADQGRGHRHRAALHQGRPGAGTAL
ncbi:MAG: hypothetical protein AVDCRST_MAG89-2282, partial [uncultured Gemmatimonadetes bacterium]